ncbi:MmcQ/YjbR family DNA-binding protein [Undibacterium flavidum]|uniref:MmcQ/YjbR family DNA-binding protein n=1 Tax=Undibacterium flavidum TaxID=2762297 RepID=A0ABR6YHL3_9BURK|nr:MmcQ/YjbR family DNA-binding protein [Undibacterium flavidum]MBC3876023.1 MmcQ/YjbR family DNA-binding protein [Undibacterium flavidum]
MDIKAVKKHCQSYGAATSELVGEPSNILTYSVGGKHFAYFKTSEPEQWRFSIRTTPERFLELTDMPGIKPARYMGRFHWVTIVDVRQVPDDYLQELIAWSYGKALAGLTKRQQLSIAGG